MLGTTRCLRLRQRSAGSPEGNVASRLSTSRERGRAWSQAGSVPSARGPWAHGPPRQSSEGRCGPAWGAESEACSPRGGFIGTLGWEAELASSVSATLVPHRRRVGRVSLPAGAWL